MNEATIANKQNEVNAVVEQMKNAGSLLFVDYLGLTVAEVSELRNKLHAENCQMKVIKNNILRRAAAGAGWPLHQHLGRHHGKHLRCNAGIRRGERGQSGRRFFLCHGV